MNRLRRGQRRAGLGDGDSDLALRRDGGSAFPFAWGRKGRINGEEDSVRAKDAGPKATPPPPKQA